MCHLLGIPIHLPRAIPSIVIKIKQCYYSVGNGKIADLFGVDTSDVVNLDDAIMV